jgi:peptidoglycan hydrolase-like protein with peptidoglycan-binding domain
VPSASTTFSYDLVDSVYAFQKVQGLERTGRVDSQMWARLAHPRVQNARYSSPADHIEVDKGHQVILVVRGGQTQFVFNTSTGTEGPYTYAGKTHTAHTPEGRFVFFREVDGWETSHLGRMYRPKYFDPNGFAVHGDTFVPSYPASHGCVRVSLAAMDFIWGQNLAPRGSQVFVYGQSPPGKLG